MTEQNKIIRDAIAEQSHKRGVGAIIGAFPDFPAPEPQPGVDPNREAFEVAAKAEGFHTDKINGEYIMLTKKAWRVWKWAKAHAALERTDRGGLRQERPGT